MRPRNSISVVYGDAKLCVTYRQENGLICCKRKMNLWFKLCYCKEIIINAEFHSLCKCWYWHFNIELKNYVFQRYLSKEQYQSNHNITCMIKFETLILKYYMQETTYM